MATVVDLLRQLALNAGPDGGSALRGPLVVPGQTVAPFALDLPQSLTANWSAVTMRPTTAQQALALAAMRADETVVFTGDGSSPREDMLLMLLARLLHEPDSTALWLVPTSHALAPVVALLKRIARRIEFAWAVVDDVPVRGPFVRLVVATYDDLHRRLLPFADRGWRWLWRHLRTVAVSEMHDASAVLSAHLPWLLRRVRRVVTGDLTVLGALGQVADATATVRVLLDRECRVIDSSIAPKDTTLVVLWRCIDRQATLAQVAGELRARGLSVAVVGRNERDSHTIDARVADGTPTAHLHSTATTAIAVVNGIPRSAEDRAVLLRRGYRMIVMLAADEPYEMMIAAVIDRLKGVPRALPVARDNIFITTCHLQYAAGELPLMPDEIQRWNVQPRIDRLVEKQRLQVLTDDILGPGSSSVEPGTALFVATTGETPLEVRDSVGRPIDWLRPSVADWRGLPGVTWAGELVVSNRSDDPPAIDLSVDDRQRYAVPSVTYRMEPREQLATQEVALGASTTAVARWRVQVHQRVEGLREYTTEHPPATMRIAQPVEATWTAQGCAIAVGHVPNDTNTAGWSIKEALPFLTCLSPSDVIVTYDDATQSLWLIETDGGGTGAAEWLAAHTAALLETARALARACVESALYRPLAQVELDWLTAILDAEPMSQPNAIPSRLNPLFAPTTPQPNVQPASVDRQNVIEAETPTQAAPPGPRPGRSRTYGTRQSFVSEPMQHSAPTEASAADVSTQTNDSAAVVEPVEPTGSFEQFGAAPVASETSEEIDNVAWQPEDSAREVDDISWEPDSTPDVPVVDTDPAPHPRLGREASVPLNAPREAARYPSWEDTKPPVRTSHATKDDDAPSTSEKSFRSNLPRDAQAVEPRAAKPISPQHSERARTDARDDEDAVRLEQSPTPRPAIRREQVQRLEPSGRKQGRGTEEVPPGQLTPQSNPQQLPLQPPGPRETREPAPREKPVDVGSMIARMRRMREEREREQSQATPPPISRRVAAQDGALRFRAGQRIRCVPYGEGVIQTAALVDGREHLTIAFPTFGTLDIDPDVNAVRVIEEATTDPGDDIDL